ncbi:hypothetical protein HG536_0C05710 [Torulaspora globosa]|uniref:UvrD-like helicase ATP-binding domain-containing protein n=1 Tax=Torulaspora globosa TaxID=48254 RepID=A0A7G3ZFW6_9SACH|nr:uncharacterized protein HG536_0C05710 [Torulaspora globosa]QLL32402.1 hypothetical protein HG536_0C05710 [Torulaspora globosa]
MGAESQVDERQETARKYVPIIERVYAGVNQDISESSLLGELLKLIAQLPKDFHLFCDPYFEPISIFCLTIFSFNEQETMTWLKNRFNPALASCDRCILNFTRGKCKMLQHFAIQRHVPHEHVAKFNDIVCLWRIEAVLPVLRQISNDDNTAVRVSREIELAVYECICNPHMLRLNKEFKMTFDAIFKFLYLSKESCLDPDSSELMKTFLAGMIYCWCEGTTEQIKWARAILKKLLIEKFSLNAKTITPDILEEVNIHLLFLQNPANWNEMIVSQFWSRLIPVFSFFDKDSFIENFEVPKNIESLKKTYRFPIESIFKLWYHHLGKSYRDKPLEFLLRGLDMLLEKLGPQFWSKIDPYTFHSILDIVFDQDYFASKLIRIQDNEIPEDDIELVLSFSGCITDMVSWTLAFYRSLTDSKRIQMVKKVSMAFLRVITNQSSLKSIPKACLMNSSTALLAAVLTISNEEREKLYEKDDFEVILYSKTDSRALLNNSLIQDTVIRSATNPTELYPGLGDSTTSVSTSAMMVLTKCISFDILMLCQTSYKLYSGKHINSIPFSDSLLKSLTEKLDLRSFHDGPLLAKQLLVSLKDINGLLVISSKDHSTHNAHVKSFLQLCTILVGKFADILPKQLSTVLADEEAAQGFWSCIFSPNTELYQAATNILYDTFDVEGRLEGIQAILAGNLTAHLRAINRVLHQLIKCEFYEPCPRAIRVLMDIVTAFTDPIGGVFSNFTALKRDETDQQLYLFWELAWSFLDTIYRCTLIWATKYEYSELENFTKDTLDLSRALVDSYREFTDILQGSGRDFFASISKAVRNMLYWLRLSDQILLDSCVKLIVSTSDLAGEKHISFSDDLVEQMAKYGSKAKKYSNKLSEQQAAEILTKSRNFNHELTDKVVAEAEAYHKEKALSKLGTVTPTRLSPSPSAESRADFLQRKAVASSITGRPKSTQPKITSFGTLQAGAMAKLQSRTPKPLSKMELARRQLLSNRVVHPPSNTVFHSKSKPIATRNGDSSSDESEDDIETARELFATAKAKGAGIQTLDINGKVVHKSTSAERAKIEEENMRRRLNVDLNPLYETALQWDYTKSGDYPDDNSAHLYKKVKDSFTSVAEYREIIRPLLLLECWQSLCSTRDREDNKPFSIIVGNRTAVSDFYDVYASITRTMIQEAGITDSDLIVLAYFSGNENLSTLKNEDFKKAAHTCLAKVRTLKYTKGNNVDITLRIHRNHNFSKFLTLRSEIYAVKVMQMTTVEREYSSLEALEYYDLVGEILRAAPSQSVDVDEKEIETVKSNYKLNSSQAEAIVKTVSKEGFSLIQGPPGTGKTKTILGIIGYFLSTRNTLPMNVIQAPKGAGPTTTEQLLKKQKILICAPSNAAVDEIVLRLKGGILNRDGGKFQPSIVRVGRSDAVNAAIRDLTLEELVDKQVNQKNYEFSTNPELEKKFSSAVSKRRELRAKLDAENGSVSSSLSTEDIAKLQMQIRELSKELNELGRERDEIRERNSVNYRNRELDRRNAQARILASSNVICSTLSGSAHDVLSSLGVKFDTVIVDEACQCTELSSIIPLRYGGKRCIMVGDPNQLPPTVLSGAASNFGYNQSLFVRMEKHSLPYLLDVQYRMHPSISKFPSSEFYNGRLKDGPDVEEMNIRPWHKEVSMAPYKFFDIVTGRESQNSKSMSYVNMEEIRVAIELIEGLLNKYEREVDFSGKIGIISPYKEQVLTMKRQFRSYFGASIAQYVDFNTIDGFQGQEKEIIVISCVRADDSKSSVGFLKDFRRMNVALTRAKTSMWILGHQSSLTKNKLWRHLISNAKERGCLEPACPGFLKKTATETQRILKRYEAQQAALPKEDDYDPHSREYIKKPQRQKRRHDQAYDGGNASGQFKVSKKIPELSVTGTKKKKSSIFGGPTIPDVDSGHGPYIKEKCGSKAAKTESDAPDNHHILLSDTTKLNRYDESTAAPDGGDKLPTALVEISDPTGSDDENNYVPRPVITEQKTSDVHRNARIADDDYEPSAVSQHKHSKASDTDDGGSSAAPIRKPTNYQSKMERSSGHEGHKAYGRRQRSSNLFIPKKKPQHR